MLRNVKFGGVDWNIDLNKEACDEIFSILARGSKIGVACSGGTDSVFALYCVADMFAEKLSDIYVLHFNHKVRANAELDEEYVKNLCLQLKLNFVRGEPESSDIVKSENYFRELRLQFFKEQFKQLGLAAIAQGHHCGDVLETSLMRLARGAGCDGFSAPRPVSHLGKITFVRPILGVSKTEIVKKLEASKISWREDESNAGMDFFRNRIRNAVIPILSESSQFDVFKGAVRSRNLFQEDSDFISDFVEREFEKLNGDWRDTSIAKLGDTLSSYSALVRRVVLKFISCNNFELRSGAVDSLVEKIVASQRYKVSVSSSGTLRNFICYEPNSFELSIQCVSTQECESYSVPLKLGKNVLPNGTSISVAKVSLTKTRRESIKNGENDDNISAYIDLDSVGTLENGVLIARSKQAGDAYTPLGLNSPKKVKEIFNAKKVPSAKRNQFPRVCNKKGEILWVPSLPPSNKYKIRNAGSAIELTFRKG